jgi:hypothetical protein
MFSPKPFAIVACVAFPVPHILTLLNSGGAWRSSKDAHQLSTDEDILNRCMDRFPISKRLRDADGIARVPLAAPECAHRNF